LGEWDEGWEEIMKIIKDRDASKRLTISVPDITANNYNKFVKKIATVFNLKAHNKLTVGFDEIFKDYYHQDYIIGLEWDIWCGFIIVSKNKNSEKLVNEIFDWLRLNNDLM